MEKQMKIGESITVERTDRNTFSARTSNGYFTDRLTYEEMLGVIAMYIEPEDKPCLHWLEKKENSKK